MVTSSKTLFILHFETTLLIDLKNIKSFNYCSWKSDALLNSSKAGVLTVPLSLILIIMVESVLQSSALGIRESRSSQNASSYFCLCAGACVGEYELKRC